MKLGETISGVTVWAVLAGREPGQRDGLAHLTRKGPGDAVCLHAGGVFDGRMEHYGPQAGTVSGPCPTQAAAERTVAAFLAGLSREPASASGPAAGETVLALAGRSPGKWLRYTLRAARRRRRDANEAAGNQFAAAGTTAEARQRNFVAGEAARGRRAAEAAAVVTGYARVAGVQPPAAGRGAGDGTSPYSQGRRCGRRMTGAGITRRPGGDGDGQWREYVAGYAAGFRDAARPVVFTAEAAREQAHTDRGGSAPEVIRIPLPPETAAYHAQTSARFAAGRRGEGRRPEPAPETATGGLAEGPRRIDSSAPALTDGRDFPCNFAGGVPGRAAPASPPASQPGGPASPWRTP